MAVSSCSTGMGGREGRSACPEVGSVDSSV